MLVPSGSPLPSITSEHLQLLSFMKFSDRVQFQRMMSVTDLLSQARDLGLLDGDLGDGGGSGGDLAI